MEDTHDRYHKSVSLVHVMIELSVSLVHIMIELVIQQLVFMGDNNGDQEWLSGRVMDS